MEQAQLPSDSNIWRHLACKFASLTTVIHSVDIPQVGVRPSFFLIIVELTPEHLPSQPAPPASLAGDWLAIKLHPEQG